MNRVEFLMSDTARFSDVNAALRARVTRKHLTTVLTSFIIIVDQLRTAKVVLFRALEPVQTGWVTPSRSDMLINESATQNTHQKL